MFLWTPGPEFCTINGAPDAKRGLTERDWRSHCAAKKAGWISFTSAETNALKLDHHYPSREGWYQKERRRRRREKKNGREEGKEKTSRSSTRGPRKTGDCPKARDSGRFLPLVPFAECCSPSHLTPWLELSFFSVYKEGGTHNRFAFSVQVNSLWKKGISRNFTYIQTGQLNQSMLQFSFSVCNTNKPRLNRTEPMEALPLP